MMQLLLEDPSGISCSCSAFVILVYWIAHVFRMLPAHDSVDLAQFPLKLLLVFNNHFYQLSKWLFCITNILQIKLMAALFDVHQWLQVNIASNICSRNATFFHHRASLLSIKEGEWSYHSSFITLFLISQQFILLGRKCYANFCVSENPHIAAFITYANRKKSNSTRFAHTILTVIITSSWRLFGQTEHRFSLSEIVALAIIHVDPVHFSSIN